MSESAQRGRRATWAACLAIAAVVALVGAPGATATTYTNVPYAPPDPPTSKGHLLDLFIPDGAGSRLPVLIWTQGSAWTADSGKSGAPSAAFNAAGYAVVGVSIRSSSQVKFPGQSYDLKAAVRFLRQHAAEYGLDPKRFAIMGNSSGGWAAAFTGTTGGVAELAGNLGSADPHRYSDRVQAAVPLYPPTDFLKMNAACLVGAGGPSLSPTDVLGDTPPCADAFDHDSATSPESSLIGCAIQTCPAKVQLANPIRYISPDDPPFFIMHGTQDSLVPYNQGKLLYNALRDNCKDAQMLALYGHNHENVYLDNPLLAPVRAHFATHECFETVRGPVDIPPPPDASYATILQFLARSLGTAPSRRPEASFTASPATVQAGQTVTFDASASTDDIGSIIEYAWDLDGDGTFETTTTSPTTTYSYSQPGAATVSLKVTDDYGDTSDVVSRVVTVEAVKLSVTAPTLSRTKVKGGELVTFATDVTNLGGSTVQNVAVRFLLDGAQLGATRTIAALAAGARASITSDSWSAKDEDGTHTVTVVVDPGAVTAWTTFSVHGNKVRNGSFEQSSTGTSPDAWTSSGATSYQSSGGDGGANASAGPGGSWTSAPISVDPGSSYSASVAATGTSGTLLVQQLDGTGRVLASTAQTLLPTSVSTVSSLGVTAAPSAAAVRIVLLGGLIGTATFDDVALVQN
jgi:uncharacterized repeat protein (TIGR01451 family)